MSSYLAHWYDPELKVADTETVDDITKAEIERLVKLLAVAQAAGSIPRRLGGDASPTDLALDKRRAKRIGHVAAQLLGSWSGKTKLPPAPAVTREAATVDWKQWWAEHRIWLMNRQRYIATWCLKYEADAKWCKSALVKLNNELLWLEHALRS
jgi:hypothetical protein